MTLLNRRAPRRAATVVETAMVISLALMFIFAIFEYGRYVMTLQVLENAAREGARMALAHTNDKTEADIKARVNEKLANVSGTWTVTLTGVILRPQSASESAGQVLSDWSNASRTDGVSVEITGDFRPVLPSLLRMPANIPVRVRSVMYSEGN